MANAFWQQLGGFANRFSACQAVFDVASLLGGCRSRWRTKMTILRRPGDHDWLMCGIPVARCFDAQRSRSARCIAMKELLIPATCK